MTEMYLCSRVTWIRLLGIWTQSRGEEEGEGGGGEWEGGARPSESCHMTPEPIWVNGFMATNDAAPPPRRQRNSFTPGLSSGDSGVT